MSPVKIFKKKNSLISFELLKIFMQSSYRVLWVGTHIYLSIFDEIHSWKCLDEFDMYLYRFENIIENNIDGCRDTNAYPVVSRSNTYKCFNYCVPIQYDNISYYILYTIVQSDIHNTCGSLKPLRIPYKFGRLPPQQVCLTMRAPE